MVFNFIEVQNLFICLRIYFMVENIMWHMLLLTPEHTSQLSKLMPMRNIPADSIGRKRPRIFWFPQSNVVSYKMVAKNEYCYNGQRIILNVFLTKNEINYKKSEASGISIRISKSYILGFQESDWIEIGKQEMY